MKFRRPDAIQGGVKVELRSIRSGTSSAEKEVYISDFVQWTEEDYVVITAPVYKKRTLMVQPRDMFESSFLTQKGVYKCRAGVIKRGKLPNGMIVVVLKLMSEFEKKQRRQFFRMDVVLKMKFAVLTEVQKRQCMEMKNIVENIPLLKQQLEQQNLKYIKAVVLDISGGGMKFTSFVQQNPGDSLLLLPELPEELEEKIPLLIGTVVSSDEILGQEPPMFDNRISFEGISGTEQEEIVSYIFKEELKKKKQKRI